MDRAILLTLRRKLSGEKVERLRHAEPGLFNTLAAKLARFGVDHGKQFERMRPGLPEVLNDRQQDNWDPLLAIADLAGVNWPKDARRAALAISGAKEDSASTGEELLSDIRDVFDACGEDRLWMKDILEKLCEDELAPWPSWNRGKPMTARQLGARLSEFGLRAKPLKIDREVQKGFERKQFADAWARYLNALSPDTPPFVGYWVTRV
jgi:putative DNA primase/helicase